MDRDKVIAIGLLTQRDLVALGPTFTRAWPVDDAPAFSDLVAAIDQADKALQGDAGDGAPIPGKPAPR